MDKKSEHLKPHEKWAVDMTEISRRATNGQCGEIISNVAVTCIYLYFEEP